MTIKPRAQLPWGIALALVPGLVAGRGNCPAPTATIPHRPAPAALLLERDDVRREVGASSENDDLNEAQRARLAEIRVQLAGPIAALDPEIQDRLALSGDQRARLAEAEWALATRDDHAGLGTFEDELLRGFAFKRALATVVAEVLTPEQRLELQRLGGRPFPAGG
jgi:hypothetical protein